MDKRGLQEALKRLITEYWVYFDKSGYLNSDGRRFLVSIAKQARNIDKRITRKIWRILKNPSIDNVIKLTDEIDLDLKEELVKSLYGPQSWRLREGSGKGLH